MVESRARHTRFYIILYTCLRYTYRFSPRWDGFFFIGLVRADSESGFTDHIVCRAPRDTLLGETVQLAYYIITLLLPLLRFQPTNNIHIIFFRPVMVW